MRAGIIVAFFLLLTFVVSAQKYRGSVRYLMPPDKVILKSGEVETGKVIFSDSSAIRLLKQDYSEKIILRTSIDSISGLSWSTPMFSFGFGPMGWKNQITQRIDTVSLSGFRFDARGGIMRNGRFCLFAYLNVQAGNDLGIINPGIAIRRYFFGKYYSPRNFYGGFHLGHNFPYTNMNRFFDLGWSVGYERVFYKKYRLFVEYNRSRAQKHEPKPAMNSLLLGFRIQRNFEAKYARLNLRN